MRGTVIKGEVAGLPGDLSGLTGMAFILGFWDECDPRLPKKNPLVSVPAPVFVAFPDQIGAREVLR